MRTRTAVFIQKDVESILTKVDFTELNDKSILITGASGLLGHYLIASLKQAFKKGVQIHDIFLVVKSEPTDCFMELIRDIPVKTLTGDLTNLLFLSSLPNTDYIIHAAGYGQPGKFMMDPVKTLALNTVATLQLFEKLKQGGKYLFLSTSEVYSGLNQPPFQEEQIGTTNTDHFRACYIEGKRSGEALVYAFRLRGINAKSARLSLAYGPGTRTDDARVINDFIRKAILEKKIELKDSGSSMRTYLYVTDAVEILFNILFKGGQGVYNVGGHSRTSILDLAGAIGNITGIPVSSPGSNQTGVTGAPDDVYLDMTRAETEFGKKDYVSLTTGLQKTIEWQTYLYAETNLGINY